MMPFEVKGETPNKIVLSLPNIPENVFNSLGRESLQNYMCDVELITRDP